MKSYAVVEVRYKESLIPIAAYTVGTYDIGYSTDTEHNLNWRWMCRGEQQRPAEAWSGEGLYLFHSL